MIVIEIRNEFDYNLNEIDDRELFAQCKSGISEPKSIENTCILVSGLIALWNVHKHLLGA